MDKGFLTKEGLVNISFVKMFQKTASIEEKEWFTQSAGATLSEKMYLSNVLGLDVPPVCKTCGNPVKFVSYGEGYREYCSTKCRALNTVDKCAQTCLERYGVRRPAQSAVIRNKMKATCLERHGVTNMFLDKEKIQEGKLRPFNGDKEEWRKSFRAKMKEAAGKREELKGEYHQRTKETNLLKYGHTCSLHFPPTQQRVRDKIRRKYITNLLSSDKILSKVEPLFDTSSFTKLRDFDIGESIRYKWKCKSCNEEFEDHMYGGHVPRCPICYPSGVRGVAEVEIADWLSSIHPGKIVLNDRRILKGLELDIYLPGANLAIELNELYFHSEGGPAHRGSSYHINKTTLCEQQGIHLFHFWDSDWYDNKEIVKSIISAKLNLSIESLGARKCVCREITSDESRIFFNENHIQGYARASIRLGLFYNDELVSALLIGKNRYKTDAYEIVRFASKRGMRILGALSKLWSQALLRLPEHFIIFSYADRRLFSGQSNEVLGFKLDHINPPGFYYTKNYKILENRLKYQKHKLEKLFPQIYDKTLTEWQMMQLANFDRVWDCGTYAYKLEK